MMNFIIIPIVLFLVCISLGVVTKYIAHFQERKNNFVVGFVMLFASFYLISTPFMLLNLKFSYMIYVVKGFLQITLKRNASSATAERLFHF